MCVQAGHGCCATVQEILQAGSLTPRKFQSVLLHLDDAMLSCCAGGSACVRSVLAVAARSLHTQSTACKEYIQQLQAQPSTSAGRKHSSTGGNGNEEFVAWIEVSLALYPCIDGRLQHCLLHPLRYTKLMAAVVSPSFILRVMLCAH